jgi:hypothetical protein
LSAKCHVCGVGRPEHPHSENPICHGCRRKAERRREKNLDAVQGAAGEQAARAALHEAIVDLRVWRLVRGGWDALSPYRPLPEHRGAAKTTTP